MQNFSGKKKTNPKLKKTEGKKTNQNKSEAPFKNMLHKK